MQIYKLPEQAIAENENHPAIIIFPSLVFRTRRASRSCDRRTVAHHGSATLLELKLTEIPRVE